MLFRDDVLTVILRTPAAVFVIYIKMYAIFISKKTTSPPVDRRTREKRKSEKHETFTRPRSSTILRRAVREYLGRPTF